MTMDGGRVDVHWDNEKALRVSREGGAEAVFRGSDYLLARANETVPYLEGILQASGHVSVDKEALVGVVSYDTPYAIKQHEDTTLRHTGKRRALWLRLTMQERVHDILEIMARSMRGYFS